MKPIVIFLILLISVSCFQNTGFDTVNTDPPKNDSGNNGQGDTLNPGTPSPAPAPSPTPNPNPIDVPAPPLATLPPPPTGGNISCSIIPGRFSSAKQICNYAEQLKEFSCIKLNNNSICNGFGPCIECKTDGFVPPPSPPSPSPGPSPSPSPTPAPTPTPTPPTPYPWPNPPPGSPPPTAPPPFPSNLQQLFSPSNLTSNNLETLKLNASIDRTDGVMLSLNRPYNYDWAIYTTLNPEYCFNTNYPLPFPEGVEELAQGDNFHRRFDILLDTTAPDDIYYCYMFTGRGIVETTTWGFRVPMFSGINKISTPKSPNVTENQMTASRDRTDGILIEINPAYTSEFTDLYVTPDVPPNVPADKNNCPNAGTIFTPAAEMRYVKVMDRYFNGKKHLDNRASFEIDLCYFLVSRKSNKIISSEVGYRKL